MNVVDSSAWIEYAAGGSNAPAFRDVIRDTEALVVPVVCLYEVYKRLFQQLGEDAAQQIVGVMMEGEVVPVDADLAVQAAHLSVLHRLPMADSLILATARRYDATVWTQDADFAGLADVQYIAPG